METRRNIKIDDFYIPSLSVEECIDLLMRGIDIPNDVNIDNTEEVKTHNSVCEDFGIKKINAAVVKEGTCFDDFISERIRQWDIPDYYKTVDVREALLSLCASDEQKVRVLEEFLLFEKYELIPVLQCLMYIVDEFRKNKYVWGVGRGSSVSSYCLYLLGVHKIDSIKYGLDIKEFLKDG